MRDLITASAPIGVQDVVGMSYFHGPLGQPFTTALHVCIDHLADGGLAQSLYTGAALVQPILRAARCVRGNLTLHGQACTPAQYIAAWRAVQAQRPQFTLDAWFTGYSTTTTMELAAPGATHAHWLSPVYRQACARLFGANPHGVCTAQISRVQDIHDAITVLHGRAAFGLAEQTLNETLQVHRRSVSSSYAAIAA